METTKLMSEARKQSIRSSIIFAICVFLILMIVVGLILLVIFILMHNGVLDEGKSEFDTSQFMVGMALLSIFLGMALTPIAARIPLRPLNTLLQAMEKLANGDFKTRLEYKGIMGRNPSTVTMFNRLASELDNSEMMRSDFINNFSHEFKTPIVSIAGFAELLKDEKLDEEQRREYLDIIQQESMRLAYMATNVLNLTKVENQTILKDISNYNLSEQIRTCVLLLEPKWSRKDLDIQLNFDEFNITGNEELLKEVWINLIDNAIKYAPLKGLLLVSVEEKNKDLIIKVSNNGPAIPEDKISKIYNKFYQADESHASEGNGVGLAIVKKIVTLHEGVIDVETSEKLTTFTVIIPKSQ